MNPPYIPATALDGTLITGWSGPCEVLAHARFPVALPDAAHLAMLQGKSAWVSCFLSLDACAGEALPRRNVCLDRGQNFSFDPSRCRMRLDPRREEVATRIATVLRAKGHEVGHLLPVALGGRQGDVAAEVPCIDCDGSGWHIADNAAPWGCPTCGGSEGANKGSGTIRRTIPAADVSAVLLAASVAGMEAGRGVVREVWRVAAVLDIGGPCYRVERVIPNEGAFTVVSDLAAFVRTGIALLDPTAPFGVVVPFLCDGREVPNV